jgi:hypothetical protein
LESLEDRRLLAAGLVAAYAFDEGSGTTLGDSSGSGNVGTITGGAVWNTAGKFGKALSFDGVNDIVNVADSASLDLTTGMTLEAWVRPTSQSGYRTIIMKDVPGELSYTLYGSGDVNRPNAWIRIGATSSDATGTAALPLNTWSHLAATYDGTALRLYVNGAQIQSRALTGAITTSNNPLHIGGNAVWGEYFAGLIDEARIYNRALSPTEVQADMNAPVGVDTTAPVASVTSPVSGSTVLSTVTLNATATDNVAVTGVQFLLDGQLLGPELTAAPYTLNWDTSLTNDGPHTLSVRARDAAGNLGNSAAVNVNVQNAPGLVIDSPAAGATITSSTVVVNYHTFGNLAAAGVDHAHFSLNGVTIMDLPMDGVASFTGVTSGTYTLEGWLVAANHNEIPGTRAAPVSVTVDVDTQAPSVSVTSPSDGANVSGSVTISASASDDRGVAGVRFLLDGNPLGAEDTSAPYSISWDSTTVVPGPHTLTAVARDAAGNSTTSNSVGVTVLDISAPTVAITSPANNSNVNGIVAVNASASDNVGVLGVQFQIDGAPVGAEDTSAPYTFNWDTSTYSFGQHTLAAVARDAAGNSKTSATVTVNRIDPNASKVYYLSMTAGGTVTGTVGSAVTFTDADILRLTVNSNGTYEYRMFFDGSDVGLTTANEDIDAFEFLADGSILVSTVGSYSVPIPGGTLSGAGEDVLKFSPTSLGDTTAGTWSLYFDGSDVGLTGTGGTIDALAVLPDARLLISVAGQPYTITGGPTLDDEDVVAFTPTSLGNNTAGSWSTYFDGTAVALNTNSGEDVDALYVRPASGGGANPTLIFSTRSAFAVPGVSGTNHDLFAFNPTSLGATTAGTYGPGLELDGNSVGLGAFDIDGAHIGVAPADDSVPPTVALTSPATGAQVSGTITLNADASDNIAVVGVQFMLNGSPIGAEDTSAPYSVNWNSTTVANGDYQLTAVARDAAGNLTTSAPIGVTVNNVDTVFPTVSLTAPANNASVNGPVTLSATASDNIGVLGVQFLIDGSPVGAEDTTAPYSITWDSTTVGNGNHSVAARARDAAGNVTTSATRNVVVTNAADPSIAGQWSAVMNWPLVAINMVLLKTGKILMWDGGPDCIGATSPRLWDPATNTFTPVPSETRADVRDIFCSAQTVLADGRVLVVGGHECVDTNFLGEAIANLFDPVTQTWTKLPDMAYRRWYPTATTLPDGRALVTAGSDTGLTTYVPIPEVYNPVTNTFTKLTAANMTIPNYPFMFVLPDGRVLQAGSDEAKGPTRILDVATQTWTTVDPRILDAGSAVMYRPGMVMKSGSAYYSDTTAFDNDPAAATTYVIDMNQPSPAWQQTASMAFGRAFHNLTILADGTVLATGGARTLGGYDPATAVFPAELWSPTTKTWTTMASEATPRMYHSTSLLLPDGRVLSAGGGHNFVNNADFFSSEIYSPPYLFKGARPTITTVAPTLSYNSSFFVGTPDGARIASVALIRNGAVTHEVDMDQRYVPLTFQQTAGGLTVQAPANANLAPPGVYMLFIVDSNGVPAVAPFVRFPAGYEDAQPPTAPGNLTASGAIGSATLNWTAATDNTTVTGYNVYRSTTPGFTPAEQNRIATVTSLTFTDSTAAPGTYYYLVRAVDAAGNIGPASNQASANVLADTTAPSVSITAPAQNATVTGTTTLTANASDDGTLVGVRFLLDGNQIGAEDTTAPYSIDWNSATVANGPHLVTAIARDAAGHSTTSAAVSITVSNAISAGLVAAYSFDQGAGATATDSSGNTLNGSIVEAAWSTSGKFGGALSFDGVNDIVNVADANALDLTTGMTLEAWVRPSALTNYRTVIMKDVPGELAYTLYASRETSRPNAWVRVGAASQDASGTAALPLNAWSHLAATYNGATLNLYVNGTQVASRAIAGSIQASANPLHIGGNAVWGEYFAGLIDEVRIYNRALSVAEIQSDMNTPITPPQSAAAASAEVVAPLLSVATTSSSPRAVPQSQNRSVFNSVAAIKPRRKRLAPAPFDDGDKSDMDLPTMSR